MCCERIVDPDETRGVPGEVWPRRKYSLDGEKKHYDLRTTCHRTTLKAMSVTIPKQRWG